MAISYKKLYTLALMLMASVSAQAMEIPKPIPTQQELDDALCDAVEAGYQYQRPIITPADTEHAVIEQLLQQGADANMVSLRYGIERPLCVAARMGQPYVVELLLNHKALVDAVDLSGTSLEQATYHNHQQTVELLLRRKASIQNSSELLLNSIIRNKTINYVLIAIFLRHPHIQAYDITSTLGRYSQLSSETSKKEKNTLDKARWLTYHADTQARMKEVINATALTQDTAGIVAQYAGTYHHIEAEPVTVNDIPLLSMENNILNNIPCRVINLIAGYAAFENRVAERPLLPGKPKSEEDLKALAEISAIIPTSEAINKAVLETR